MAGAVFGFLGFLARPPTSAKAMADKSGCGVWANAGPGVSRGSTPGFLATRRVGWEAGAAKDE